MPFKQDRIITWSLITLISIFLVFGCKTPKPLIPQTAEDVFKTGLEKFKSDDYIEATSMFNIIKLQYPASSFADDAQFYLAEVDFKKKEFIMASYEYNTLRRIYPTSEYYKESLFKTALCYYELSPDYDRDPEYIKKAIETMQDFQRLYPADSLYSKVTGYIDELRNRLAQRNYNTAELYRKLYSPKSSLIYLDFVIEDYTDTKYYELAYLMKIDILVEIRKYADAKSAILQYKSLFPKSANLPIVLGFESKLPTNQ